MNCYRPQSIESINNHKQNAMQCIPKLTNLTIQTPITSPLPLLMPLDFIQKCHRLSRTSNPGRRRCKSCLQYQ